MFSIKNKILYLDDDKLFLKSFSGLYSSLFQVFTTDDYNEALNILRTENIKVVVSDYKMPDINGIDFIKLVNTEYPDIECIITSGYADKDLLFRVINEVKTFNFIEKPWIINEFTNVLRNAIKKYNFAQEKIQMNIRLKQALEKSQESDRLKQEFLASISHEVRTPVNGIIGFSNLLKTRNNLNEESNQFIEIITKSANQLVSLVDDMITAAEIHAGAVNISANDVFLNELLDELHRKYMQKIKKKENIDFVIKRLKKFRRIVVTTDKEKVYSIFNQLIKNAIKFTHSGTIEFGVYNEDEGILYVKDTGTGISEEDQTKVFDFFRQGKQKIYSGEIDGIGVGLSIVKGLINLLKGEIWFESELNVGTTFYFKIPIDEKLISTPKLRERFAMFYS